MKDWSIYRSWCKETGSPCLVVPAGIKSYGKEKWKEDGFHYVGRKKMGRYMVLFNYSGVYMRVRRDRASDLHRFEHFRWSLMVKVQRTFNRLTEIRDMVRTEFAGDDTGRRVLIGEVDDRWMKLIVNDDDDQHRLEMMLPPDESQILDEIAMRTRTDREYSLVRSYYYATQRLTQAWTRLSNINHIMTYLMRKRLPEAIQNKPWGHPPVAFTINGRRYLIYPCGEDRKAMEFWPNLTSKEFNLDIDDEH